MGRKFIGFVLLSPCIFTIKKHITGKGNATKYAVLNAIKQKGFEPRDNNEADSLALLDYVLSKYGKE
ncbi:hypothetical protein [Rickettsia endosymbiont of Gonocerus acuteangulatus]|uniref:hypothetical protein n=1 Tax=Rickettsia endosymbiont of Gonocerus acuteangulatus TaxID=3066266 RepID=UPI003132A47D